ncbi:MAG TPA: nucleoside triphosphate pyrophosphohydrolase [Candidatus Limnocylindria bacterium]|nr:nucleoside triphosphate pyrophosphohydrolase [Candidatus Limnocylindria bacterium]
MHTITVVALGPGSPDLLTLGALRQLKKAARVVLRTARHAAVPFLEGEGVKAESLDALHDSSPDFDALAGACADRVLELARKGAVTYAVADPARDETVRLLRERAGDAVRVLPGVAPEAHMLAQGAWAGQWMVSSAVGLAPHDAQQPLAVTELDGRALAGEVKLKLLPLYGDGARVLFFPPSEALWRKSVPIPLADLDRQPRYDHTAGFVVYPAPLLERTEFDAADLLAIMRRLRARDGCPWDREQTHLTLVKHLVEEANEAAAALLEEDWDAAADELGDVMLQLAFHAVVGEEQGTMEWGSFLRAICGKLIRRHPHVFGESHAGDAAEALTRWEEAKGKENRPGEGPGDRMDAVPKGLAPLLYAEKVQKIAAKVGFDWHSAGDALSKVGEEAQELREAMETGANVQEELGDLLFSAVNVARLLGMSADEALRLASGKFVRRFKSMEISIKNDKKIPDALTDLDFEVYWNRSKTEKP